MEASANKLNVTCDLKADGCILHLEGTIDESFEGRQLAAGTASNLIIDLDGVKRITSFGVRQWMQALNDVKTRYCCFIRCRPAVLIQFNTVANFAGPGELLSFYSPYICNECGNEIEVLTDRRVEAAKIKSYTPAPVKCPSCGADAEFDEVPQAYFSYAAKSPLPSPPPEIDDLLSGKAQRSKPFQVDKEVDRDWTLLWFSGALDATARFKRLADGLEGNVAVGLKGLGPIVDEGVSRFALFLKEASAKVYLSGIGEALLRSLKSTGSLEKATVVSIKLPFRCERCRAFIDLCLEISALRSSDTVESGECPLCGGRLAPAYLPEALQLVQDLPVPDVSNSALAVIRRTEFAPNAQQTPGEEASKVPEQSFGRYKLIRPLGSGGMAEVFLALQTGMGGFEKQVVVKRILPSLSVDKTFVEMFLHEARIAAKISHPNVVQIFDVGQAGSQYYMAMEYVRGWDLNFILRLCQRLNQPFPVEFAARVVADVCAGLHAAHTCTDEQGKPLEIVHRDVSPHNVLLSTDGRIKLTDFGIAKAVDSGTLTPTATIKGKLSYMAPEQVRGQNLDARSDIFPAGQIFYLCLTLEQIFRRDSDFATLKAVLHDPIPAVLSRIPTAPPMVEEILSRALAREPAARYPTALAFQQDLEYLIGLTGRLAGPHQLATWIRGLLSKADVLGHLPSDMAFTPTSQSPGKKNEVTMPTVAKPKIEPDDKL